MENTGCDEFGKHEVLDRAWLVQNTFETFLVGHPVVLTTPELHEAANLLNEQLVAFYGLVGRITLG